MTSAVVVTMLAGAAALLLSRNHQAGWRTPALTAAGGAPGRQPPPPRSDVPVLLELVAAMLAAGSSVEAALLVLSDVCDQRTGRGLRTLVSAIRLGAEWDQAWAAARASEDSSVLAGLENALTFAVLTGAPSASMLSARAQQARRRTFREAEQRAAELGVLLVLPMGLCALPAFVCWGVVPVVIAMLPTGG